MRWGITVALASLTACFDPSGLGDFASRDVGVPLADSDPPSGDGAIDSSVVADSGAADSGTDAGADAVDAAEADVLDAPDVTDTLDTRDGADADAPDDGVVAPPFCDPTDPNLVGCYRFDVDVSAAQPHDDSKYANDGTSTSVGYVAGIEGKAMSFTPASSYTHVPDSASLDVTSALTLETWALVRSLPTPVRAGLFDDDGQYGLFILASGAIRCSSAPAIVDTPASTVTVGAWMHVACTYDGAFVRVYVNGAQVAQGAATGLIGAASTVGVAIGMNSPSGDVLDGAMDDLRIFGVARTAAQICKDAGRC